MTHRPRRARRLRRGLLALGLLLASLPLAGCTTTVYESDEDRVQHRRGGLARGAVHDIDAFDVIDAFTGPGR